MDTLEKIAAGKLPDAFPFAYSDAFDAGSPYSLIIAFFPETSLLSTINFANAGGNDRLEPDIAQFVSQECAQKGWAAPLPEGESHPSYFLKIRMRLQDDFSGDLTLPSNCEGADDLWVDGCVRVLKLWRKLLTGSSLANKTSLRSFENTETENTSHIFAELCAVEPDSWHLKQRLEFLLVPYCRYAHRIDLLQDYIASLPLSELHGALNIPEVQPQLLQACLDAPVAMHKQVLHLAENIHNLPNSQNEPLTKQTLNVPSKQVFQLLVNLASVAQLSKLGAKNFRTLAEWSIGPAETQQDLLRRTLLQPHHVSFEDISLMRLTVFSNLTDSAFSEETIRGAFQKSRFMFLKSLPLAENQGILKHEIKLLIDRFASGKLGGTPVKDLQQILASFELLEPVHEDKEMRDLQQKYQHLRKLTVTFPCIDPYYALTHSTNEVLARVLEQDSEAYLRYTDLLTVIGEGNKEYAPRIAEQCVESALANDDFSAAYEYFERGFISDSSPSAWLAYYQTGNYMSPQWDIPKSARVLQKQTELMAKSLNMCPAGDLMTVLKAWNSLESDLVEATQRAEKKKSKSPQYPQSIPAPSNTEEQSSDSLSESTEERTAREQNARDQLQNMLVSGLGWAIGANPRR